MSTNSEVIGTAAAAAALGIDRSTLTRRVKRGTIKPYVTGTGTTGEFLFLRSYIEALTTSPVALVSSAGAAGGHTV